jgi:hypothetical protein
MRKSPIANTVQCPNREYGFRFGTSMSSPDLLLGVDEVPIITQDLVDRIWYLISASPPPAVLQAALLLVSGPDLGQRRNVPV